MFLMRFGLTSNEYDETEKERDLIEISPPQTLSVDLVNGASHTMKLFLDRQVVYAIRPTGVVDRIL